MVKKTTCILREFIVELLFETKLRSFDWNTSETESLLLGFF